jgi:hypothetical protein
MFQELCALLLGCLVSKTASVDKEIMVVEDDMQHIVNSNAAS